MLWVTWKIYASLGGVGFKTRLRDVPARKALGCPQHCRRGGGTHSDCCCSLTKLSLTLCNPWASARQAPVSSTISQSLLKFTSTEPVMPSNHLILCHPLLFLPSIFPSIRVFSSESPFCIRWPKYWSFSNSSFNAYSGLISFRIDWFDPLGFV